MIKQLATLAIWAVAVFALAGSSSRHSQPGWRTNAAPVCSQTTFEGATFTICRTDLARHELRLVTFDSAGKPLRDFVRLRAQLGGETDRLVFAMNAGMYDWDGYPIGLHVEEGRTRHQLNLKSGEGNFHLAPNGVFWIDSSGAHVASSAAFAAMRPTQVSLATQSGPMLVIGGALHPKFSPDGPSRYVRNGVGIDPFGNPVFVISNEPVSFGRFARLFRDRLGCRDALFLDGLVSALWDGSSGRNSQTVNLGPMLAVLERK